MKKNRISVILFLAVLLSVIIYSAYGMVNQGRDDDYISISVIVNESSNARWDAFREGLEQGAEDNQVHLNLVSTGSFQNAQEEHTIVKRELEGDAAGVIVETYSSEADSVLQGAAADSVVLVKTGVETDTLYTFFILFATFCCQLPLKLPSLPESQGSGMCAVQTQTPCIARQAPPAPSVQAHPEKTNTASQSSTSQCDEAPP